MMIKFEILLDVETGTWDLVVRNLTHPGESMDYIQIRRVLHKIFGDLDRQVLGSQEAPAG